MAIPNWWPSIEKSVREQKKVDAKKNDSHREGPYQIWEVGKEGSYISFEDLNRKMFSPLECHYLA